MKPQGEGWITSDEAARILNMSRPHVNRLARRGELTRFSPPSARLKNYYWREDVEALARAAEVPMTPGDRAISTREAARILNVNTERVSEMIRYGLFQAYRKLPGKAKSPYRLRERDVRAYARWPERRKRREAWKKGQTSPSRVRAGWERWDGKITPVPWSEPSVLTGHDYGEFYTARQVGQLLGISRTAIDHLRQSGRLVGHKKSNHRRSWWFYRKVDVDRLRNDPQYNANHRRYKQANTPEKKAQRKQERAEKIMAVIVKALYRRPWGNLRPDPNW